MKNFILITLFCFLLDSGTSTQSIYCCGNLSSLLPDGNFEASSDPNGDYTPSGTPYPGEYTITDSPEAIVPNWTVYDHSSCEGGTGQNMLIVNGRTSQPLGTSSVIYQVTINDLSPDTTYQLCGFYKNLVSSSFDVTPQIRFSITNSGSYASGWREIAQDPSDPCAWQKESVSFTPSGNSVTISILLREGGNGDGNDLAMDDLSLFVLPVPELDISVEHETSTNQITASINSLDVDDDVLPGTGCRYIWLVAEASDATNPFSALTNGMIGDENNSTGGGGSWGLTTTFSGYNGGFPNGLFEDNQLYIVLLYVYECDCYDTEFVFQYTFSSGKIIQKQTLKDLDAAGKQGLKSFFLNEINSISKGKTINSNKKMQTLPNLNGGLRVFPNPSNGLFYFEWDENEKKSKTHISVWDFKGRQVFERQVSGQVVNVDLSTFPKGVYHLKVRRDGNVHVEQLVKL